MNAKNTKFLRGALLIIALFIVGGNAVYAQNTTPFVTTWEVTEDAGDPEGSLGITIPTNSDFTYSYTVEWGDGSVDTMTYTGDADHTYHAAGIYTVSISGTFPGIAFRGGGSLRLNSRKIKTIKQWGDNSWETMERAFQGCSNLTIEGTAGNPDLSNVTDMSFMFYGAVAFNQNINGWDVSNVTDMDNMFFAAYAFNQSINRWDVSNVKTMRRMFTDARTFNQGISEWNVSNVTDMGAMFSGAVAFNQSIGGWDVSKVTNMGDMFSRAAAFNRGINRWDVSNVTDMGAMFGGAVAFNQDLSGWDVGKVTDMTTMFSGASAFNQVLKGWDVSNVTEMDGMFSRAAAFNSDLRGWDVSKVTTMAVMFSGASAFNQDLSGWDVSKVTGMNEMFMNAVAFNQNIGGWDVSKVTNMSDMFRNAVAFNQDIGGWDVSKVAEMFNMFLGATLSTENYDALLRGWSALPALQTFIAFHGGSSKYCAGDARTTLTDPPNRWFIRADGGEDTAENCARYQASFTFASRRLTRSFGDDAFTITPTGGSGTGSITYESSDTTVASVSATSGEVTIAGAGATIITATKAGATTYNAATATYTLVVTKAEQAAFAFANEGEDKIIGDPVFTITPTDGPGSGAITWESSVPTVASVSAASGEVTIITAGMTTITATKAADSDYNEATATYILTIAKAEQAAFAFASTPVTKTVEDTVFTFTPTGGSGSGAITWESSVPAVASVSATSGEVTIIMAGMTTITAIKAADTNYNAATTSYTLVVKANQAAFTFANPAVDKSVGDPAFTFTPTGGSGSGAITWESSNPAVASVSATSGEVTIVSGGTTTITAIKAADATYNEATASYSLTVDDINAFVTTWEVTAGGGIIIPTNGIFAYSYTVNWGDSILDTTTYTGNATHTYTIAGIYTVSISGIFPSIYFNASTFFGSTNSRKILTIKQWGDNSWKSMNSAFRGCENLTIEATAGNPDLSNVTDMSSMFSGAYTFNQALNGWDVSNVTNMRFMFVDAYTFNQDLGGWDVGKVTDMSGMFYQATTFNRDLGGWDVSKVTDMSDMFYQAAAFNQNLNEWDVSKVRNMSYMFFRATAFNRGLIEWDVRNVRTMESMFYGAIAFNQALIEWDVSNVTTMESMFNFATAFNQDLGGWNVGNVSNMAAMFDGDRLSIENYDALLRGWSALPYLSRDVTFGGGVNKYCAESARDILVNIHNWRILDGEKDLDENCARYQESFIFAPTRLTKRFGDAVFTFTPTGGTGAGGITYQSSDTSVATIAATTGEVTIVGGGTTTITATKAGDSDHNEAIARYILTIPKVDQAAFAFASTMVAKTFGDTVFTFTPTGGPGSGAITWESSDRKVATISATSGEVTIVNVGTTTITATKAADATYNEATASYTLIVTANQAAFTFAIPAVDKFFGDPVFTFTPTGGSGTGAITWESSNPTVAIVSATNGEVTIVSVGTTTITATKAADTVYNEATASYTLIVRTPLMFADGAAIAPQTYPAGASITTLILPEASGGVSTLIYSLMPPPGLIFDPATRTLSGTPTTPSPATTLAYTSTDSATPTPNMVTLDFTITVVMVTVGSGGKVAYSSGAIAVTDVGDDNNDMRLMLPAYHEVDEVTVNLGTYTPTPSNPLPNGATYSGVGVDIELKNALEEDTAATVCLSTAGVSGGRPALYHWTGTPAAWEEIGNDTSTQPGFVCGMTATFSPFVMGNKLGTTTRLNEQILTRAAQAMTAGTLAAVAARVESAVDGGGKPLAYQLDGQSSLRGLLEKNGKAMLEEQMDYERLLDGASFVLPLATTDDASTDDASTDDAGKTAVWGSSDFRNLADDEDDLDWDGQTLSAHLGMDRRFSERTLAGLALSWNNASFDFHDTANNQGEYRYSIVNIHPYFGWSNAGLKLWGTAGFGQGEIEITFNQKGSDELSTDTTQRSLAGGFSMLGMAGRDLYIKGDVAITRVAVEEDESGNFAEQDMKSSRTRLLLSGERRRELASGGALTPSLEIGIRQDGGDGVTGTGTEVGAGLRYANAGGTVTVVANFRTLVGHEYEESGAGFVVQRSTRSGRGVSLTLHPVWGRTQSVADKLWNDGASDITGGDPELRVSVDTEVGYGLAATILGTPGILTPYTGMTAVEHGTSRLRLGGRFADGNGLSMNLEGTQKSTSDGASHTVLLRGEVSF